MIPFKIFVSRFVENKKETPNCKKESTSEQTCGSCSVRKDCICWRDLSVLVGGGKHLLMRDERLDERELVEDERCER